MPSPSVRGGLVAEEPGLVLRELEHPVVGLGEAVVGLLVAPRREDHREVRRRRGRRRAPSSPHCGRSAPVGPLRFAATISDSYYPDRYTGIRVGSKEVAMRVFVAGATGVLGRRAVRALVAAGHEVTAVVRSPAKADARAVARRDAGGGEPVRPRRVARRGRRSRRGVQPRDAHPAARARRRPAGVGGEHPHPRRRDRATSSTPRSPRARRVRAGVDRVPLRRPRRRVGRRGDARRSSTRRFTEPVARRARRRPSGSPAAGGRGVVLRFGMFVAPDSEQTLTMAAAARGAGSSVYPGRRRRITSRRSTPTTPRPRWSPRSTRRAAPTTWSTTSRCAGAISVRRWPRRSVAAGCYAMPDAEARRRAARRLAAGLEPALPRTRPVGRRAYPSLREGWPRPFGARRDRAGVAGSGAAAAVADGVSATSASGSRRCSRRGRSTTTSRSAGAGSRWTVRTTSTSCATSGR